MKNFGKQNSFLIIINNRKA